MASLSKFSANARGPPVLPDNRPVRRGERSGIPDHRGLTLVGDPYTADAVVLDGAKRLCAGRERGLPDLIGTLLDPPRSRKILTELRVTTARDTAIRCDDKGGDA